jgi:hypothetical protein
MPDLPEDDIAFMWGRKFVSLLMIGHGKPAAQKPPAPPPPAPPSTTPDETREADPTKTVARGGVDITV